jgi:hypothetical protein
LRYSGAIGPLTWAEFVPLWVILSGVAFTIFRGVFLVPGALRGTVPLDNQRHLIVHGIAINGRRGNFPVGHARYSILPESHFYLTINQVGIQTSCLILKDLQGKIGKKTRGS